MFDRDDLLTNLTIYWATQIIGSSIRLYYETAHSTNAAWGRVQTPTAMAMSDADMFPTPPGWIERQYNVVRWTDLPGGGHFLEWRGAAAGRRRSPRVPARAALRHSQG